MSVGYKNQVNQIYLGDEVLGSRVSSSGLPHGSVPYILTRTLQTFMILSRKAQSCNMQTISVCIHHIALLKCGRHG